jgi:hypothetical protein
MSLRRDFDTGWSLDVNLQSYASFPDLSAFFSGITFA